MIRKIITRGSIIVGILLLALVNFVAIMDTIKENAWWPLFFIVEGATLFMFSVRYFMFSFPNHWRKFWAWVDKKDVEIAKKKEYRKINHDLKGGLSSSEDSGKLSYVKEYK